MDDPQQTSNHDTEEHRRYWHRNKVIIAWLLAVWFLISFGLGIIAVVPLNKFSLGGFPFGFWMAQQGGIYLFIVLIGVYCFLMEREDKRFHVEEQKRKDSEQ